MNVLAIGSDRSILNPKSASALRQIAYGKKIGSLSIIVFSRRENVRGIDTLSSNVHVYPTASFFRLMYGVDAFRIARRLPRPDIVTVQDPFEAGLIGWIIARTRGAKLHVQVHTDMFAPQFALSPLNRIRLRIARFVVARADRIRVVSERIKEGVERNVAPRAPMTVLPIYTDIARFKHALPGELAGRFKKFTTKLLVVSRLEREKNVILAIESFAKAAPADSCLIIVGEGSDKKRLEARVAYAGLSGRVFFEKWQDPAPFYALADLVLFPSLYDGYGLVIIEALAAGKPVLSTDVGVAGEAGAYIIDPAHFADALKEWFKHGDRSVELKNYPYHSFDEYVEKYCADIAAAKE